LNLVLYLPRPRFFFEPQLLPDLGQLLGGMPRLCVRAGARPACC